MNKKPLISIVTPAYNSAQYIEECILSIMSQTYENFEHIIVDGCSTDGTLDIIKEYEDSYNMRWISEKDNGMYDAIYKGFLMANGDIYAWINSDDKYMPWTCQAVAVVMQAKHIEWCNSVPAHFSEDGICCDLPNVIPVVPTGFIRKGYCDGRITGCLQQESMFWSKGLWEKCGSVILNYNMAGDYHLWKEFSKYTNLYTIDTILAGFRIHEGQKSSDLQKYFGEIGELKCWTKVLAKTRLITIAVMVASLVQRKKIIRIRKLLNEA